MDNRRAFLKKIGLVGVAITSVACLPKTEDKVSNLASLEPTSNPTIHGGMPEPKWKYGFTGFRTAEQNDAVLTAQKAINSLHNARVDNLRMEMQPDMLIGSQRMFDHFKTKELLHRLDPFNWGDVFDLKWIDWHATDVQYATKRGVWEARVRPEYHRIFKDHVYMQSIELPMEYLAYRAKHVEHAEALKDHAKRRTYEEIVDKLQEVIRLLMSCAGSPLDVTGFVTKHAIV